MLHGIAYCNSQRCNDRIIVILYTATSTSTMLSHTDNETLATSTSTMLSHIDNGTSNQQKLTPTNTPSTLDTTLIAIAVVIVLVVAGATVFVIILVVLIWKKTKNKSKEKKTEPAYYNTTKRTATGEEAFYTSPQDVYYSTVDKSHTKHENEEDGQYAYATTEQLHNSEELQSLQVYDDIVGKNVKNKFTQPNAAIGKADDVSQMYSVVDTSAKKGKKNRQRKKNDDNTSKCQNISEMYAVVDKKAKNKSVDDRVLDEYAAVDKSAKTRNR